MTGDNMRNMAAPCGLYCSACVIYCANKRGDSESLKQIAETLPGTIAKMARGMPPLRKEIDLSALEGQKLGIKDFACEGCLSETVAFPCRICGLRACALEKRLTNCSQCADSPCQQVIDFSNDGFPHHGEVLANIRRQRDIGIDAWITEEEARWRCPRCGCPTDWYAGQCHDCAATLSGHFSWPEGWGLST
jgi:hypothetical protein